MTSQNQVYLSS